MNILKLDVDPTDDLQCLELPAQLIVEVGQYVIFRNEEMEEEAGLVKRIERDFDTAQLDEDQRASLARNCSVLRIANDLDKQKIDANEKMIDSAMSECEQLIDQHHLGMRLVTAHFSFTGKQVLFVFTAESRVDFRGLVKDLARHFKRKVRLKQIGPRDRARYVGQKYGAYGRCGRPLCCATFLKELDSVTMDMVRVQNLANKGASKLSGVCGKLMSCLQYEVEMYKEFRQDLPEVGVRVQTQKGNGVVTGFDILSQMVTVTYDDATYEIVHQKNLSVISSA